MQDQKLLEWPNIQLLSYFPVFHFFRLYKVIEHVTRGHRDVATTDARNTELTCNKK